MKVKSLSHVRLLAIPWTAAYQAPSSLGFSRQEYWSGLPLTSPEIGIVLCICNFMYSGVEKKDCSVGLTGETALFY